MKKFAIIALLMAQPAFAHKQEAARYLSLGVLYKLQESKPKHESDGEEERSKSKLGLDLNFGYIFAIPFAAGFNAKHFEDRGSIGAFIYAFGVYLELGAVRHLQRDTTDPYLALGLSMGYAELSARRIFDTDKKYEVMIGLKLPLGVDNGLSFIKP